MATSSKKWKASYDTNRRFGGQPVFAYYVHFLDGIHISMTDMDKLEETLSESDPHTFLQPSPELHDRMSGATLEARPKTDGLTVKRGMKGKPKPLYFWDTADVNKWLRKHGGLYYELYGELLSKHDVTGRTLIRVNDIKLEKIGILDSSHRHDLMQFILRLRLKHETSDLRSLNQRGSGFELKLPETRQSSMDKAPAEKFPSNK